MPWVRKSQISAASDITTSALVRSASNTQTAVKDLIGTEVSAAVDAAVAASPTVANAAALAVAGQLAATNIPRAYPETPVTQSSLTELPMQWTYKTLNDPYGATYTANYEGTWSGSSARAGKVAILQNGKIDATQVPDEFARKSDIPAPAPITPSDSIPDTGARMIFGARVAKARAMNEPVAVVFVGSSTSAAEPGYVTELTTVLQKMYPVDTPTLPQWSTSATFTKNTGAGIHAYSAAEGGATSANYLDNAESDRVAALTPAMVVTMVGSNDYTSQRRPAEYAADLKARLAYLDGIIPTTCLHVLVHAYARRGYTPPTYAHAEYLSAMRSVARARPGNTIALDLSSAYRAVGVPGADPLGLIGPDLIHQTPAGYIFMANILAANLTEMGGHYA